MIDRILGIIEKGMEIAEQEHALSERQTFIIQRDLKYVQEHRSDGQGRAVILSELDIPWIFLIPNEYTLD